MRAAGHEKEVLKLVHPGRYVEIHKQPIPAAEIMRKNPRHCITRPDVFEYPWIVVKPESILNPGRVFFIVPNHTIYNLLKARGNSNQPESPKKHTNKQTSPSKFHAGMTPKHRHLCRCLEQQCQTMTWKRASPCEQDFGKRSRRQTRVESSPKAVTEYQKTYLEYKRSSLVDSTIDIRSSHDEDYHFMDERIDEEWTNRDDTQEAKLKEEGNMLKSCLRKQDSVRKSLCLKVSFLLPEEDHQRRVRESQTELQGYCIC